MYTQKVIYETLRLRPPIWTIAREALNDDILADYDVSKGDSVVINAYWMHRNPEFWAAPDEFNPERFGEGMTNAIHKYAFVPFGAGPRVCIGNHFAMMEMVVILIQVLQKFKVSLVKDEKEVECSLTLRPKQGMEVFLKPVGMVKNLTGKK